MSALMEKTDYDRKEQFEYWLADMDRFLEDLRAEVPAEILPSLDFSAPSLDVLEAHLLERFESIAELKASASSSEWNNASVYLGETIRKQLGGTWRLQLGSPETVFFGLPVLEGVPGSSSTICPMTLVSASLDRRTGHFLSERVKAWSEAR